MRTLIYLVAFLAGAVLMAFEIIASRYLTPYFGSGVLTWSALISVVLLAIMAGYFVGGSLVDRHPRAGLAALFLTLGGLWLVATPFFARALLERVMLANESEVVGALLGAGALTVVPVAALGTYSPIAVRLLLSDVSRSGRVAGSLYGVSTIGNVAGTLGAALLLIPHMGSNDATWLLGGMALASAATLHIAGRMARGRR
jgi:predicted membrane-bound spermidine synthase